MKNLEITTNIKTIDINSKEWFDKINGNSYFSARVTLNYGTDEAQTIYLPFQYGYGGHYQDIAMYELTKLGIIDLQDRQSFLNYCKSNGIFYRSSKRENCLKKDVIAFGKGE
jgi:hypothetical protein